MKSSRRFTRPVGRLAIDHGVIAECRTLAADISAPVEALARTHTTVSIERASLRLLGLDGVVGTGTEAVPLPNSVVDGAARAVGLERGVLVPFLHALDRSGEGVESASRAIAAGEMKLEWPEGAELEAALAGARSVSERAVDLVAAAADIRKTKIETVGDSSKPWFYLIVATGNIYEDIHHAQAAARNGADVIAVIRSTGQSLLDYVPYGATEDGFAGTFATQENFHLMRAALDEVGEELGRYIRLTNYASGLCMPEIAAIAAVERLDMMLNDCMYGIIFRDINMQRTLTKTALVAGLPPEQMGLGHAFEIDPEVPDQILLELAHAQLIRECFPDAPLKYMPPTKHMTGDIFQGFLLDGMFNLVGAMTGQDIMLLGMLTEGVHTPFLSDRDLALNNASYIFGGAAALAGEMRFDRGGLVERRAAQVLEECRQMLHKVADIGMFSAIEAGMFADTVRARTGGKGLDGVIQKSERYVNPIVDGLEERVGVKV